MKIKWKHLSSKEKDELIGLAVKALVELSKGGPHAIPTRKQRYWVDSPKCVEDSWRVMDGDDYICFCHSEEDAYLVCEAMNA